jgi:hypothetical protein
MAIIEKKTWKESFEAIESGKKSFDFRAADFPVSEGDTLVLREYDPVAERYTGRSMSKKVSYVGRFKVDSFGQREIIEEKGFVVLSLE